MSDYDAACDYQYCGKWNDPFTEKSGGRLIWKQLWFVCRSRCLAVNQELFKKLKETAKKLCKDATGRDIIRRYEEIFRAEEER